LADGVKAILLVLGQPADQVIKRFPNWNLTIHIRVEKEKTGGREMVCVRFMTIAVGLQRQATPSNLLISINAPVDINR